MADQTRQVGISVDAELWQEFRENVEARFGSVQGNLAREAERAFRAYLRASEGGDNHDRIQRIEQDVAAIREALSEDESDRERDSVSSTTEDRMDAIMEDLLQRSEELGTARVPEDDIEAAIEREAGTTYKTLKRYKQLLKNQRKIFEHPDTDGVFFVRPTPYITFVETNYSGDDIDAIRGDYADTWWEQNAPDGMFEDRDRGGFQ